MYKKIISIILIASIMLTSINLTNIKQAEAKANTTNAATVFNFEQIQSSVDDTTDTDNDGVYDKVERIVGTSAEYADTDGDGLNDYFELINGLNPLQKDTNDDGVDDLYEITKGEDVNPQQYLNLDTDRDGIPNIFDTDNDNDGVADYIDISPFSFINNSESKKIIISTKGDETFVTIQVSPDDVNKIINYGRSLAWPEDFVGQIRNIDEDENIKINPYLRVKFKENSKIASVNQLKKYGQFMKDGYVFVPLQKIEAKGECVGYQAVIFIPKNGGIKNDLGNYNNEMELELSYMMTLKNDYLNQDIHIKKPVTGSVNYEQDIKQVKITGFDDARKKQFLNTSIGDLNKNGEPDLAAFYVYYDDVNNGNVNITYDIYYDLDKNMQSTHGLTGLKFPIKTDFKYVNKDDDKMYTYLSRYDMQIVDGEICAFYYNGKEQAAVYTAGGYGNKNTGIKINNGSRKYFLNLHKNDEKSAEKFKYFKNKEFVGSKIYDTAGYYDKDKDTYFYLYVTEDKKTDHWDNTYLTIKQGNQRQKDLLVDFKTNAPVFNHRINNEAFVDMTASCALDIYDVDSDGKDDLVLLTYRYNTNVNGSFNSDLYFMSDIYGPGLKKYWENIKELPMDFNSNNVFARSMDLFDFNQDGLMDMVFVDTQRDIDTVTKKVKDKNKITGYSMDISFHLSVSYAINSREEILMTDEVPFKITGLQVESQKSVAAKVLSNKTAIDRANGYNDSIDRMLYVTETMEEILINSSAEIDSSIATVEQRTGVSLIREYSRIHSNYDNAVVSLGNFFNNIKDRHTNSTKPYLLTMQKKSQYFNLDEFSIPQNNSVVSLNVATAPVITQKELSLKWVINGELASPKSIVNMVNANKNNTSYFRDYYHHAQNNLSRLNIGVTRITQIGESKLKSTNKDFEKKGDTIALGLKAPASGTSAYVFLSEHTTLVTKTKIVSHDIVSNSCGKFFSSSADKAMAAKYAKFTKIGNVATGVGLFIDIAYSVYAGHLYGEMLTANGASQSVADGARNVYITLSTVKAVFLTMCISGTFGPVGYVIFAAAMVDLALDFFIDSYDSYVDKWLESAVKYYYDVKYYEGTYISKLDMLKKDTLKNGDYINSSARYWVGDVYTENTDYETVVSARNEKTPANKKSKLDNCWVKVYDVFESKGDITDNKRTYDDEKIYKKNGIWNRSIVYHFSNEVEFTKSNINLIVDNNSTFKYKIIKYVREEKKIDPKIENWHIIVRDKDYTYYYSNGDKLHDLNSRRLYFDVLPTTFKEFFNDFNLVESKSRVKNIADRGIINSNQLICKDKDGDGLKVNSQGIEIKDDGTVLTSNPNKYDTDEDGLSDYLEVIYKSNPKSKDSDNDKLTDYEELLLGTNMNSKDTDNDGISDYDELNKPVKFTLYGTIAEGYSNPLLADSDGDFVSDLEERKNKTNPASKFTFGGDLYDGNKHVPEVTTPFEEYYSLVNEMELVIDLKNHITDADDEKLVYYSNYGSVSEDGILTYIYNKEEHGETFEISITASDSKCGILNTKIIVCEDTDSPFLSGISIDGIESDSIEVIDSKAKSTSSIKLQFNEDIVLGEENSISIVPIFNEQLDTNQLNELSATDCKVELIEGDTSSILISRESPLVENNITYEIRIAKEAITDIKGNTLREDYKIKFNTVDTIAPKLLSVTDFVSMELPLILEFNEPIVTKNMYDTLVVTNKDNKHAYLRGEVIDNTFVYQIIPNQLKSEETYVIHDNKTLFKDISGNVYEGFGALDVSSKSFVTADVEGIECTLAQFDLSTPFVQSYQYCYETDIKDGEIEITFNEEIKEGEDFSSIALSYESNLFFYGCDTAATFIKEKAAEFTLPYTARIEGKSLFIKPDKYDSSMNYSVFIEEKSITDLHGSYIKNMADGLYRVRVLANSGAPSIVKAEKTDIMALISLSYNLNEVNIVAKGFNDTAYPSQMLNIMLNEEVETIGSRYTFKQSMVITDQDNNVIPVSNATVDKGIIMVTLLRPLMPNNSYTIKIKEGSFKSKVNGINEEITFSFKVNDNINFDIAKLRELANKITEKLGLDEVFDPSTIPELNGFTDVNQFPNLGEGETPGEIPNNLPNDLPGEIPEEVPDDIPNNIPGNLPGGF